MPLDPPVRDLLERVSLLAGAAGGEFNAAPHELRIATLFDRGRSLFGAIRHLLDGDFAHEAILLGRPLFTESLMLQELAASDDGRRVQLVIGWQLEGLADMEGIFLEGRSRGDKVDSELEIVQKRRDELHEYARRRGVTARAWKPNEKQMADDHGRGDAVGDFRLTHQFVHGAGFAVEQRLDGTDDVIRIGGEHADIGTWAAPAGLFSAYSLLFSVRAFSSILARPEPPGLDDLFAEVTETLRQVNEGH